jgi:hypothetical protein
MVLQEQHFFRKLFQKRVKPVAPFDNNPAGQPAYDLPVYISVQVRVKPEQPDVLLGILIL